jgi:hypothetical protein
MSTGKWTDADSERAKASWSAFKQRNDLSRLAGKTAGIDPSTGRVWIGDSIDDVIAKRNDDGSDAPLYFERVGSEAYYVKGGRR